MMIFNLINALWGSLYVFGMFALLIAFGCFLLLGVVRALELAHKRWLTQDMATPAPRPHEVIRPHDEIVVSEKTHVRSRLHALRL